jgi:hypothetical protein
LSASHTVGAPPPSCERNHQPKTREADNWSRYASIGGRQVGRDWLNAPIANLLTKVVELPDNVNPGEWDTAAVHVKSSPDWFHRDVNLIA